MISEDEIGKSIKNIRKAKNITLAYLSEKADFSKGYLSKLENSKKGPPVSTLMRIAKALEVSVSEILGENEEESPISIVKKIERKSIVKGGTKFGYSYEGLAYKFPKRAMDPYVMVRPPHKKKDMAAFKHKGQEIIYVLKGTMEFHYGNKSYILEPGDCAYFDADIEHWGNNIGSENIEALLIIYSADKE
jgi:transcriptional regulator with XRE-family HTH domain